MFPPDYTGRAVGGDYFKTFKGTSVGFEVIAGFLNLLPLFINELQPSKDNHGRVIFNVYELASGAGKLRSNKSLGLASSPTWVNCFITSGETPLVGENDGAGALNRVIEIECKADNTVIQDGHRTAKAVKQNYGHAGKMFVQQLSQNLDEVKCLYESNYEAFRAIDDLIADYQFVQNKLTADEPSIAQNLLQNSKKCLFYHVPVIMKQK